MRLDPLRLRSSSVLLLCAPAWLLVAACGDDSSGSGGAAGTTVSASQSSPSSASTGAGANGSGGEDTSSGGNGTGAGDQGGAGGGSGGNGGGGGICETGPYEVCGNDVDEDCDGEPEACPSVDWLVWIGDTAEGSGDVIDVAVLDGGDAVLTGILDPDTYFVSRYDAAGERLWRHTLTTTGDYQPVFAIAHGDDVVLAGTADEELIFDEDPERTIGLPDRTLGYVAQLDADGELLDPPLLLNDTTGATSVQAVDVVERADGGAQILLTGHNDSAFAGTIAGENVYVASVDFATLQLDAVEGVFADIDTDGGVIAATTLAAADGHVTVGLDFTGTATRRDGGDTLSRDDELSTFLQSFDLSADGELAVGTGHEILGSGLGNQIHALATTADGDVHVAFFCDDPATATFDGTSIDTGTTNRMVYLRLTPESALDHFASFGPDVFDVGTMKAVDEGAGLLVTGRGSDDTSVFGQPVVGHFIAELALASGADPDVVWARSVITSDTDVTPRFDIDPSDPSRSLRLIGIQQGASPIDDSTYDGDRTVPFVARMSR